MNLETSHTYLEDEDLQEPKGKNSEDKISTLITNYENNSLCLESELKNINELKYADQDQSGSSEDQQIKAERFRKRYRKGYVRKQSLEKIVELEQNSVNVVSKFALFHQRILNGSQKKQQNAERPQNMRFMQNNQLLNNSYSNKIKIIKDLEVKINFLENNIKDPQVSRQQMKVLENNIYSNFDQYFKEVKQSTNQRMMLKLECSSDSQTEDKKRKSFKFLKAKVNTSEEQIKELLVHHKNSIGNQMQTSSFEKMGSDGQTFEAIEFNTIQKMQESILAKSSPESSIQNIIHKFSKDYNKEGYIRRREKQEGQRSRNQRQGNSDQESINLNQQGQYLNQQGYKLNQQGQNLKQSCISNDEKEKNLEFNLPLDSFEQSRSNSIREELGSINKYNDRSDSSRESGQTQRLKEQYQQKDYCLNYQNQLQIQQISIRNLDQIKSDYNDHEMGQKMYTLQEQIIFLTENLEGAREQLRQNAIQFQKMKCESQHHQAQRSSLFDNVKQYLKKIHAFQEMNQSLLEEIERLHQESIKKNKNAQKLQKELNISRKERLAFEERYQIILDEKECQMENHKKQNQAKNQQLQQYSKILEILKAEMKDKSESFQQELKSYDDSNASLKEELEFYKNRLEDEGINIAIDEVKEIRNIFQDKENQYKKEIQEIERKYLQIIAKYKQEVQKNHQEIDDLKEKSQKQRLNKSFGNKLEGVIKEYDEQLCIKDEQINQLKILANQYSEVILSIEKNNENDFWRQSLQEFTGKMKEMVRVSMNNNEQQLVGKNKGGDIEQGYQLDTFLLIHKLVKKIQFLQVCVKKQSQQKGELSKKIRYLDVHLSRELDAKEICIESKNKELDRQSFIIQELNRQLQISHNRNKLYRIKINQLAKQKHINHGAEDSPAVLKIENQYLNQIYSQTNAKNTKAIRYIQKIEQELVQIFLKQEVTCSHHQKLLDLTLTQSKHQEISSEDIGKQYYDRIKRQLHLHQVEVRNILLLSHHGPHLLQENNPNQSKQTLSIKSNVIELPLTYKIEQNKEKQKEQNKERQKGKDSKKYQKIERNKPKLNSSMSSDRNLMTILLSQSLPTLKHKMVIAMKLIDLGLSLLSHSPDHKFFMIRPANIIFLNYSNEQPEKAEIILRKQFSSRVQDEPEGMIYRSPEVLLGFNQSQYSYVWTIGLIIDEIFHSKIFFKKIGQVLSQKNHYYCQNQQLLVSDILHQMIRKNQKERITLRNVKLLFQQKMLLI